MEAPIEHISPRTLGLLISAPFLCMISTPFLVNAIYKLYSGNHNGSFYVRQESGLFRDSPTVYGIEFCPSDFLNLDEEYHMAVPIWCSGVLLYLAFWLAHKRGDLFSTYPLAAKIRISVVLLFSSSIVGASFLLLTFFSGFFGKMILYIVGNVETTWSFDSLHLQIGVATVLGGAIFFWLILQLLDGTPPFDEKDSKLNDLNCPCEKLIDLD